ncbi:MAG: DNA/RNA nuclease SfsA [Alphaproteobacteria bacterium]|nr:DNA/RNA nuclease SfsA [Alphaproteobacteria bacterium]MBO4644621.1 DNA/RNA nuclease SfsA [Alphaproteobacteria bacterium]
MDFLAPLYKAFLIKRYAKVLADVRLETGENATVFCSNTTRMKNISDPDTEIYLSFCPRPNRRLQLIWELANVNGTFVGVNMGRQTDLIAEAIINGALPELSGYERIEPDPSVFFDLILTPAENSGCPPCRIAIAPAYEKKGADLLFPDAIEVSNHHVLNHLANAIENGERAVLILFAQRSDCISIRAQWTTDTPYLVNLKELYDNKGLEIICCGCSVSPEGIWVTTRLPFIF